MPLFKVVKRKSVHEDQVFFVEAENEEVACSRIVRFAPKATIPSSETSIAAVRATAEEVEYARNA